VVDNEEEEEYCLSIIVHGICCPKARLGI
ncbi:unnamed protein product, partial [Rotaria magnacalcarata]